MGTDSTKAELQLLLRQAGVDFPLSDHFYRGMVVSMNGTKGRTGEFLVHAAVLDLLRAETTLDLSAVPRTQQLFDTPDGVRRLDLYFAGTRFSVEIKAGYVRATRAFRKQVAKDVWLLENRTSQVAEVMWIFLRGATKLARKYLEDRHIAWMDLDIDQMRPPTTSPSPERISEREDSSVSLESPAHWHPASEPSLR